MDSRKRIVNIFHGIYNNGFVLAYERNVSVRTKPLPMKKIEELLRVSEKIYNVKVDRRNIF